jgi:hypothetical protein
MSWSAVRQMSCTVCKTSFGMYSGEMVHPADILCDECVRALWDQLAREGEESVEAGLAARLEMRMGFGPDILASQITRRVNDLREMVATRAELEVALQKRRQP